MDNKCGRCANRADKGHYFCQDCRKALEKINHTPIKKETKKKQPWQKYLYGCFTM